MDKPVELVPLLCVRCSTPVDAQVGEVAWVCANCGQGLVLDEEKGLASVEVKYVAGIPQNSRGKPFWVAEGQVSMQREAYGTLWKKTGESARFWSQLRRFFVPAFTCPLETLLKIGTRMALNPPDLRPGSAARFEPVTLFLEDVQATVEFIIMAIEAERKDKVKEIKFSLALSDPELWILPDAPL